jgi:hypothetical protein
MLLSTATIVTSGMNLFAASISRSGETVEKDGSATPKSGLSGNENGSVNMQKLINCLMYASVFSANLTICLFVSNFIGNLNVSIFNP